MRKLMENAEVEEFKQEAADLLDSAEKVLLTYHTSTNFDDDYNSIFRVFHSLKGAAGMLNLMELQSHMHKVENLFQGLKGKGKLPKAHVEFFLQAIDGTRDILDGKSIKFDYNLPGESVPTPKAEVKTPTKIENPPPPQIQRKAKDEHGGGVMVIDDEEDLVTLICDIIESVGLKSHGFTSPEKAIAEISKLKPSVVFTDINMPGLDGYAVLSKVVEIDPELPVIFVSARVSKEGLVDSISKGIFAVIEKPFQPNQIIETAMNASRRYKTLKLLDQTINVLMYQYSDLDDFLKSKGKETERQMLKNEIANLRDQRRVLSGRIPPVTKKTAI